MIGVLCGLKSEAKIADRIPGVLVGCSAAQTDRARQIADYLVNQGITRLISFGLAGAVSPDLRAGDLLLGATAMTASGAWEADTDWNDRLIGRLSCFMCVPVWGSSHIVSSLEEKQAIYRRTGCLTVDMESHIAAEAAFHARIPFNIVRAVADTSAMVLPPAARAPLQEDGSVDFKAVYRSIVGQPSQLIDLIRLGHKTALAFRALKQAVAAIGEMDDDKPD